MEDSSYPPARRLVRMAAAQPARAHAPDDPRLRRRFLRGLVSGLASQQEQVQADCHESVHILFSKRTALSFLLILCSSRSRPPGGERTHSAARRTLATIHDDDDPPPIPGLPSLPFILLSSFPSRLAQEESVRDRARERGKEGDDVPNAAPFLLPLHPSRDGHSAVLRSARVNASSCVYYGPSFRRRVCGRDLRHSVVTATESYIQPVHKPYITLCQGHRLCSTYNRVWTTLCERRYLLETQPVCLSARLDGTPMPNRTLKYLNANARLPNRQKQNTVKQISSARHTRMTPHESPASIADSAERVEKNIQRKKWGGVGVGVGTSSQSMTDLSARRRRLRVYLWERALGLNALKVLRRQKKKLAKAAERDVFARGLRFIICSCGRFGLVENVTEEVQRLRNRVELLEKKLQLVLAPFSSFFPLSLDEGVSEKTTLLSHSFQQLDRIDSLSEQIGFLEERLGTLKWMNHKRDARDKEQQICLSN
ncbi:Epidermal growth factor-like protein 7 [Collichthys lucidus]|uniref:Epidermal growth factor-like protein 7 n=1 Tax=Collichthys lucidus TaxID=240159 RepID=A0A4U5VA47_COLLU|nr:Epidermal growth factor-like protein 7 [Collichthys lucidus]